ncbi:MAG: carboxypeptidase-like regulatory domain-containing protein, partial [Gammaproteobacteria bacterium]|nr:carboxypeptidase-like regulatory domain-containing protein [Gammaproteobacteria bacterium]
MKRNTARAHHRRKVGGRALAILVMALLAQANAAAAQTPDRHWVRGVVTDSAGAALHNAMVVVLSRPDSVLAEYTLSSQDGRFTIEGLPAGGYILQVTLIGYRTLRRDFDVANAGVDAGRVALAVTALEVDSVVVSVEHVPFVNQRDTFSYNVQAFPTPP